MKKKLLAVVLCLALVAAVVCTLVACKDGDYDYEITVWVGEGTKEFTEKQIQKFNETNQWGKKFKATVEELSESVAGGNAISKPKTAADLFCFAQDQLARLVKAGVLADVSSGSQDEIIANNTKSSVDATKIGGTIRAFPMTYDNGFFMYYDKSVINADHVGSLEDILADCKAAGKNFSMNLTKQGGAWYAASFFYAMGCESEWETNDDGTFKSFHDTFNTPEGVLALKAMQQVLNSGCHIDSAEVGDFSTGTPSAVVISGIWGYNAAKKILGNRFGVAPLPSFTDANGQSHQLKTYMGSKMMGVKRQSDGTKVAYLQKLALYLTGEEVQLARFEKVGWLPCNSNLQDNEKVLASEALTVFAGSAIMPQGQYPSGWWAKVVLMAGNAKGEKGNSELQEALNGYHGKLNDLKNGLDEEED